MARIGYLCNGGAWLDIYQTILQADRALNPIVYDTSKRWLPRLSRVDILFVPWAPDAVWIASRRKRLLRFMERGGLILAFGEFENDWLPNMIWTKTIEDKVRITTKPLSPDGTRARALIFAGLTDADMANWADTAHGYFRTLPENVDVLVTNEAGQPVVVYDGASFTGAILASSIDPDFHTYGGIPAARKMFGQIIDWALLHVEEEGGYRRELRLPRRSDLSRSISSILPEVVVDVTSTGLVALVTTVVIALVKR